MNEQKRRILWNFTSSYAKNGMPIHTQLRMVRKLLGLSQTDVGAMIGVHPTGICVLENGRHGLTLTKLQRYCDALELSLVLMPKGFVKDLEAK